MRPNSSLFVFAVAATLAVATRPIAAQQAGTQPVPSASRIVATYDFGFARRAVAFPSIVTVADSAGTLLAQAAIPGQRREVPMTVTVLESDLVLQGETPDGVLTMVLDRQNEGGSTRFASGRWMLGTEEGKLRGRVKN
ncbi:MAG: hypothetical protein Q8K82_16625 [Gemmatimonadaceae bacterium]|nr:hypothetical protein [Gemmatimonadaceae bacterium]